MLSLWLPIVLSAVGVFIASSVVHMVLPYHRSDYDKLEKEDEVMQALRTEVAVYPEIALRELIANALIHQDFSVTGAGHHGPEMVSQESKILGLEVPAVVHRRTQQSLCTNNIEQPADNALFWCYR